MLPERATGAAERVLGWLRAGYPEGDHTGEYVALYGVLHRRLDDEEVDHVCRDLVAATEAGSDIRETDIRAAIEARVREEPRLEDVEDVIHSLTEHGWEVSRDGQQEGP